MRIEPSVLDGVFTIAYERCHDERGWFVRVYDEAVFRERGWCTSFPEASEARNVRRGTIRGLHYQRPPYAEVKVIRATRGVVYDVLVDCRPGPSYGRWEAIELDADAEVPRAVYVPVGIAHGYQTLTDDAELHYLLSSPYVPAAATGVRFDSPALAIPWPLPPVAISARDRAFPLFG